MATPSADVSRPGSGPAVSPSADVCSSTVLVKVVSGLEVTGGKGTPFPHHQFTAQDVPAPYIVTMLEKAYDH